MDEFKVKTLDDSIFNKPLVDYSSISKVVSSLWDEAERQLRNEVWASHRSDEALGRYVNKSKGRDVNQSKIDISDEAIFRRYEVLVQKYMLEPRRRRRRDVDSLGREIFWNEPKSKKFDY